MAPGRVRVLIAGNIYIKRALVRRFLEDDGYEVVGEAMSRSEIVPSVQREQPDVVVLDDDLLESGAVGTIPRIRSAQPDVRIVVFTSGPVPERAEEGAANGYLEKGVALSALTSLLGRLLAEPTPPVVVVPDLQEAAAEAAAPPLAKMVRHGGRTEQPDRGRAVRFAAIAAGLVLILGGFIALAGRGPTPAPQRTLAQPPPSPSSIIERPQNDQLRSAYADLDDMVSALQGGNYVLATVDAQALMQDRQAARSAGFSLGMLDQEITTRLSAIADALPPRVLPGLQDIFGPLFPTLIGPTTTSATSTTSGTSSTSGTSTTSGSGSSGGTTTSGGGGGGGSTTSGGGGGGGGSSTVLGPGDGWAWGQSHKPTKNGWNGRRPAHHGKPPWAQGPKG